MVVARVLTSLKRIAPAHGNPRHANSCSKHKHLSLSLPLSPRSELLKLQRLGVRLLAVCPSPPTPVAMAWGAPHMAHMPTLSMSMSMSPEKSNRKNRGADAAATVPRALRWVMELHADIFPVSHRQISHCGLFKTASRSLRFCLLSARNSFPSLHVLKCSRTDVIRPGSNETIPNHTESLPH
jgi:hypothetical protein